MEKPIIYINVEDSTVSCLKEFPTGKLLEAVFTDFSAELYNFMKDCDFVFYQGAVINDIIKNFDFPFSLENSAVINLISLEEHLNPRSLNGLSKKYGGEENSPVKVISEVYKAQKELIGKGVSELKVISSEGLETVDAAGYTCLSDGVLCWSRGRRKLKPVISDLAYAQYKLKKVPRDTQEIIKNIFKR